MEEARGIRKAHLNMIKKYNSGGSLEEDFEIEEIEFIMQSIIGGMEFDPDKHTLKEVKNDMNFVKYLMDELYKFYELQ